MTDIIMIYALCGSVAEAEIITNALLDEKLIACANVGSPVTSHYDWKGQREHSAEIPVFFKTTANRYAAVEARIKALHSYDVPCVLSIPATNVMYDYSAWLRAAVKA